MKKSLVLFFFFSVVFALALLFAWTPVQVSQDPLLRMPGTQPGQVALESPNRCMNCHAAYDPAVEPGFNWQGSMMAQAARDFIYYACLTVAGQDSIWAVGTPNAVDLCERCHFPKGWLEGRSDPPNASAMIGADFDGVQCDFCHRMYDPFFETTYNGVREGNAWLSYWDETNASATPSQPAADDAYAEDSAIAAGIQMFNGSNFFINNLPPLGYSENGSGQFFISPNSDKRASFSDAEARHRMLYSRYHKSKYFCGTCHDVSNPVLKNLGADPTLPLPTEVNSSFSYFHVERTFSEFMLSAYGQPGGAPTNPEFQSQGAPNITLAAKCQDCHMRDVVGPGCDKNTIVRPNESIEHPQSGQPLHDLTGGNAWVSWVLASAVQGSPNFDSMNFQQLNKGPGILTLDLTQGQGIDPVALLAGVDRAKQQLLLAATVKGVDYDPATGALTFQVQNNTPHKLISGFPEGRRMFVNIKAYAGDSLIHEINPYDAAAGTLKGLDYPYIEGQGLPNPVALGADETYVDELVYEMKPSSTDLTGEAKTFHFALATGRYKDNRIPPKGFDIAAAGERQSVPVWHGVEDPYYFTTDEYALGYDEVSLTIPSSADYIEINLYYQTTSREYMEFLRDEINGTGNLTLESPAPSGETHAYIVQSDPFFSQLKAWGDTIWTLWTHNRNVDGAAPILMTQAFYGTPSGCGAPVPTLLLAEPGHSEVALTWSDESADPSVVGYRLYYDQAGKAQLIADIPDRNVTTYLDSGLTNGQEYFYKITSYHADCESGYSNIVSAIPTTQGQATIPAGVSTVESGVYTGKGGARTFLPQTTFAPGDEIVIRAMNIDLATGLPLENATVELLITGPETLTLTSDLSGVDGIAVATWKTNAGRKNRPGTAAGTYTIQVKAVAANGYHWDGVTTSTTFFIQ